MLLQVRSLVTTTISGVIRDEGEEKYTWFEARSLFDQNPESTWRLPTRDELNFLLYNMRVLINTASGFYWTSTEYDLDYAWCLDFDSNSTTKRYMDKNWKAYVLLVRK